MYARAYVGMYLELQHDTRELICMYVSTYRENVRVHVPTILTMAL